MIEKIVQLLDENRTDDLLAAIEGLKPEELAEILEKLEGERLTKFFDCLDKEEAADVFVLLDKDTQQQLLKDFSDVKLQEVSDEILDDDVKDILERRSCIRSC